MTDLLGDSPIFYYSTENAKLYELSGAFRRIQSRMTVDALDIAEFSDNSFILDLGCGTGFSTTKIKESGFDVVGVDISFEMLKYAKDKNFNVINASMNSLPFKDESFDGLVSISTIQWAKVNEYKQVLSEIKRVIKKKAVIQFYPKEKPEFDYFIKLAKKLFNVTIYEVGEGNKKKKYILLIKK